MIQHPTSDWNEARSPEQIVKDLGDKYDLFCPAKGMASETAKLLRRMNERRDQIEAALIYTPGTHTFDDLFAMSLSGQLTYWHLPNSFMLTEIHNFPQQRHYHIFLAGGELGELLQMHADVITLARVFGCRQLTLAGRPGWERALKRFDWKPTLVTLAKEI